MTGAHRIVERLDHCRQTGKDQWQARCPAHDDNGPSLSIKDAGGGRTLIHCFAGCGAVDVLAAIGLEMTDLYPPTDRNYHAERQHKERTLDELTVEIAMADMNAGRELSDEDADKCREALQRLDNGEQSPQSDPVEQNFMAVGERESQRIARIWGDICGQN